MVLTGKRNAGRTVFFLVLFVALAQGLSAMGKSASELIVRRVDSNRMVRLRLLVDGKSEGMLKVGQTAVVKVKNGYHTLQVSFDDYQRSTEVAQFTANNSTHVFSVTDTSIVMVGEDALESLGLAKAASEPMHTSSADSSLTIDSSVRSAFDKATKGVKKGKTIAIINVDGDNIHEANFVLEELTLLSVNSPKKFKVVDRRVFDAYRTQNSIGIPSYENDFMLRYLGSLVSADYVISGRIDGPGDLRRLRVKALAVSDGALVGDSSERL